MREAFEVSRGTDATLPDDWLEKELAAIGDEVALWPDGIKESYNSLPGVVPIPLGLPPCPHCGKRRDDPQTVNDRRDG